MEERNNKLCKLTENLFLAVFGLYLIFCVTGTSTFQLNLGWNVQLAFLFSLLGTGALRLLTMFFCMPEKRSSLIKMGLCAVLTAVMWRLVYLNVREALPLFLIVLTVAFAGCNFRKVLKTYVIAAGLAYLVCVFCALGDSIPNLIYTDFFRVRSSWGIGFPTDFASYMIFLSIFAWIAWREVSDWFFLFLGGLSFVLGYFIAESRTSSFCSLVFILLVLLHMIRNRSLFQKIGSVLEWFFCFSFPIFGVLVFFLLYLYRNGNGFAAQINLWVTRRLEYTVNAYELYGVKLFGSEMNLIGHGGSLIPRNDFLFIDSTYPLILIHYGAVTFIVLMTFWVFMSIYAKCSDDKRLLYGLFLISLHSISEHHFMEVNYNVFLVLPFSVLFPLAKSKLSELSRQNENTRFVLWGWPETAVLAVISAGFLCIIYSPWILSVFRTLTSVSGLRNAFYVQRRELFAFVFAGFCFCVIFGALVFRAAYLLMKHEHVTGLVKIGIPLCLIIILGAVIGKNAIFRTKLPEWQDVIEADRPALEILQNNSPIYVTDVPEFYRSSFKGVKAAFYDTEDLARFHDVSVVVNSDFDSSVLITRGFLFTEISDSHAVYTNSQGAINALTDAGYHLTDYYSKNKAVDLDVYRELNQFEKFSDNEIIISGRNPLAYGPDIAIWYANYRVTFDLSHESGVQDAQWNELAPETPVCTLRISRNNGEVVFKETTLTRGQFTENDIMTAEIISIIPSSEGVEFLVFPSSDEFEFRLHDIHYQKIP